MLKSVLRVKCDWRDLHHHHVHLNQAHEYNERNTAHDGAAGPERLSKLGETTATGEARPEIAFAAALFAAITGIRFVVFAVLVSAANELAEEQKAGEEEAEFDEQKRENDEGEREPEVEQLIALVVFPQEIEIRDDVEVVQEAGEERAGEKDAAPDSLVLGLSLFHGIVVSTPWPRHEILNMFWKAVDVPVDHCNLGKVEPNRQATGDELDSLFFSELGRL